MHNSPSLPDPQTTKGKYKMVPALQRHTINMYRASGSKTSFREARSFITVFIRTSHWVLS